MKSKRKLSSPFSYSFVWVVWKRGNFDDYPMGNLIFFLLFRFLLVIIHLHCTAIMLHCKGKYLAGSLILICVLGWIISTTIMTTISNNNSTSPSHAGNLLLTTAFYPREFSFNQTEERDVSKPNKTKTRKNRNTNQCKNYFLLFQIKSS